MRVSMVAAGTPEGRVSEFEIGELDSVGVHELDQVATGHRLAPCTSSAWELFVPERTVPCGDLGPSTVCIICVSQRRLLEVVQLFWLAVTSPPGEPIAIDGTPSFFRRGHHHVRQMAAADQRSPPRSDVISPLAVGRQAARAEVRGGESQHIQRSRTTQRKR